MKLLRVKLPAISLVERKNSSKRFDKRGQLKPIKLLDQNRINDYKDKVINTKKLIYVFFSFPCDGH